MARRLPSIPSDQNPQLLRDIPRSSDRIGYDFVAVEPPLGSPGSPCEVFLLDQMETKDEMSSQMEPKDEMALMRLAKSIMAKVLRDREIRKWEREAMLRREMARNPIVFLDVSIGDEPSNRMIFELFKDVSPMAAENFRALCTGEMGKSQKTKKPLCYQGSIFHRVTKGYMAQGGNFSNRVGSGGESIYGGKFTEKNCVLHNKRGLLTTTGTHICSQFQILFEPNACYDRKCTVFGNLVSGYDVLRSIEDVPVHGPSSTPDIPIRIVDCGELVCKKVLAAREEHEQKWATNSDSSSESSIDRKHRRRRRLLPSDGITEDRPKDHNEQSYQVSEGNEEGDVASRCGVPSQTRNLAQDAVPLV